MHQVLPPREPNWRRAHGLASLLIALGTLAGCTATASTPIPSTSSQPSSGAASAIETRLGLITDFGTCDAEEQWASEAVRSLGVEAIITAGDNSQNESACVPYTRSVWGFYPRGADGRGDPTLWPTLGNHDYDDVGAGLDAYRRAFPHLGDEADPQQRWYTQPLGHVRLFAVDSQATPDVDMQRQRAWLQEALGAARAADPLVWNVVVFHHPPYTSGVHAANVAMRPQPDGTWDLREWGADLVVSGHQHIYEDIVAGGLHYVTAGVSAGTVGRDCPTERVPGSRICLAGPGIVQLLATPQTLVLEYRQRPGDGDGSQVTDTIRLTR